MYKARTLSVKVVSAGTLYDLLLLPECHMYSFGLVQNYSMCALSYKGNSIYSNKLFRVLFHSFGGGNFLKYTIAGLFKISV